MNKLAVAYNCLIAVLPGIPVLAVPIWLFRLAVRPRGRRWISSGLYLTLFAASHVLYVGGVLALGLYARNDPIQYANEPPAVATRAAAQPTVAQSAAKPECVYKSVPSGIGAFGTPPTSRLAPSRATIQTNLGLIEVELEPKAAPCTVNSLAFLAAKGYYDNSKCHRLTTAGIYVLQCGDPSGTGTGHPGYGFGAENLPTGSNGYPAGTVAMAGGPDVDGTQVFGSQFFIIYKDSPIPPNYTVFGHVTSGLAVVQQAAARGVRSGGSSDDGPPASEVRIQNLTTR